MKNGIGVKVSIKANAPTVILEDTKKLGESEKESEGSEGQEEVESLREYLTREHFGKEGKRSKGKTVRRKGTNLLRVGNNFSSPS